MIDRQPNSGGNLVMPATAPVHERISVRRRRSRRGHRSEHRSGRRAVRSRSRWVWTLALSAGVLLLMALGLYFGLARQESAPSDGATHGGPFRATAIG